MKRLLLLFISIFLTINIAYGFTISDSSNTNTNYFSINSLDVFVKTDNILSNFSVKYSISNETFIKSFDLISCESNNFCGNFNILNLINNENNTFSGSTIFNISIGNESQIIYLDLEKPEFNLINSSIDTTNKLLNLKFNYSDNFENIKSVEIYKVVGSSQSKLANLLNKQNYNYSLTSSGNITLKFIVSDFANNYREFEKVFEISDLFVPKINSYFITLKDGKYSLKFNVSDNSLKKYEISQNGLNLYSEINGTNYEREVSLPFEFGSIELKVFDLVGNVVSEDIFLKSPITNGDFDKFVNKKQIKISSNADSCYLIKFDSKIKNQLLTKDSKNIIFNFDFDELKNYNFKYYCDKDNFREYFTNNIFFDDYKPTFSNLSIFKENSGNLRLIWTKSEDLQSNIKYILYKNGEKIYSGSKLEYLDTDVVYPNLYKYMIKVFDEAGNYIESNEVSQVPKKVVVALSSNFETINSVKSADIDLKINTDKNSKVIISVKNSGNIIFKKILENSSFKLDEKIKLKNGLNQINIESIDEFGNVAKKEYFVEYNDLSLSQVEEKKLDEKFEKKPVSVIGPVVLKNESIASEKTLVENNDSSFSIWWVLLILLILILVLAFYFGKEDERIEKIKEGYRARIVKKNNNNLNFLYKRKNDNHLEHNLKNITKKRKLSKYELELKKKKEQNKKPLSDFEKQKISSINKKSNFKEVDFSKKSEIRIKNHDLTNEHLKEPVHDKKTKKISFFIFNNFFKKKEEIKKDDFSQYLSNRHFKESWESPKEYLLRTKLEEEKIIQDKLKAEQEQRNLLLKEEQDKKNKITELKNKKERKIQEEKEFEDLKNEAASSLDDYLSVRTKKKRWFFAEKEVEKDLKSRK